MADDGVTVSLGQMWELLQAIEHRLIQALEAHGKYDAQLLDQEKRLRELEAHANLSARVDELDTAHRDLRQEVEDLKRRVWAIPSIAAVAAVVAILLGVFEYLSHQ